MKPGIDIAIGELSRRTGCGVETIRYYERIGVLPPPARTASRYRQYRARDVERLMFVRRARELGFTLDEVRSLLTLVPGSRASCGEARALAARHRAKLRARIADLRAAERLLSQVIRRCDAGETTACPIIEALSADPSAP